VFVLLRGNLRRGRRTADPSAARLRRFAQDDTFSLFVQVDETFGVAMVPVAMWLLMTRV
jgi:hypothetical protein